MFACIRKQHTTFRSQKERSIHISTGKFDTRENSSHEKNTFLLFITQNTSFFFYSIRVYIRIRLFLLWIFLFVPIFSALIFFWEKEQPARKRKFPRGSAWIFLIPTLCVRGKLSSASRFMYSCTCGFWKKNIWLLICNSSKERYLLCNFWIASFQWICLRAKNW